MKKLLLGIGVGIGVVTALILAPIGFEPVGTTNASNGDGCPDGSYNIGTKDGVNPICKLEPTGCVNGDSIPLDSPKCENNNLPKEEPIAPVVIEPVKEEPVINSCGK